MAPALVSVLRPWLLRLAAMRRETLHGLQRDLEAPIRRRRASCAFGGSNGPRSGQSAGSAAREPIRPQSPTPNENRHPRRLTSRRSKEEGAPSTPSRARYPTRAYNGPVTTVRVRQGGLGSRSRRPVGAETCSCPIATRTLTTQPASTSLVRNCNPLRRLRYLPFARED